jgi:hypothetical protein
MMFREYIAAAESTRGPWYSTVIAIIYFGAPSLMAIAHRIEASCLSTGNRDISQASILPHNLFNAFEVLALGSSLIDSLVLASSDKEVTNSLIFFYLQIQVV